MGTVAIIRLYLDPISIFFLQVPAGCRQEAERGGAEETADAAVPAVGGG